MAHPDIVAYSHFERPIVIRADVVLLGSSSELF